MLSHPRIAARSCDECHVWLYNSDGTETRRPDRIGPRQRRPLATVPSCGQCPKQPTVDNAGEPSREWRPALAVELSDRNWQAWRHYRECQAVNWNVADADDPIVRRNAAIIREVEEQVEKSKATEGLMGLLAQLKVG